MKLHIGGKIEKNDWKILNIQNKDGADFIGDISDLSQFEEESINEIYASHVFEHVPQKKIISTLSGINRVLKTGGKFYLSVPDIDVLFKFFLTPLTSYATKIGKTEGEIKMHILRIIFGGQMDQYDFHYFGWNFGFLKSALIKAKFTKIEKVINFNLFEDTSNYKPYGFPISLNVVAFK